MSHQATNKPVPNAADLDEIRWRDVADGILRKEFQLHYQPQVDAADGRLLGFEALIRWHSWQFGPVSPDRFVPMLERNGRAEQLWHQVLGLVALERDLLGGQASRALHVALNLSASQLHDPTLAARFVHWLQVVAMDASQIHIELTESAFLEPTDALHRNLATFRDAGVAIWLDDFGTGFSSLRHLRDLPVSGLKIDRSFVQHIETEIDDFRIVSAIVAMACSLGLRVVAEGVETQAQAQILTQLGCTSLQGYLIGKPQALQAVLRDWA